MANNKTKSKPQSAEKKVLARMRRNLRRADDAEYAKNEKVLKQQVAADLLRRRRMTRAERIAEDVRLGKRPAHAIYNTDRRERLVKP